ncbi:MAG TPA: hypothetical protein VJT33_06755 [bacterium]|nr:hypothetical protein [bacterium]
MEDRREDRLAVQCFTCPRERRADEPGWHYVDVPSRARAYGPSRIYVCPRHYRHFAERERGRWIDLDAPVAAPVLAAEAPVAESPVLVAAAAQSAPWGDATGAVEASAAGPAIAAAGLIESVVSDS